MKKIKDVNNMDNLINKSDFRKNMTALRESIPESIRLEKSQFITSRIIESQVYKKCHTLLCFIDMGSEPKTKSLITAAIANGKKVACPSVISNSREMDFYKIESFDGLIKSRYGVLEPLRDDSKIVKSDTDTLIIIPGLAFDVEGYRIGYGGGYYDTYLANNPQGYRMGIAFSEMIVERVPRFCHDIKIDSLITDKKVYTWKN